MPQLHINDIPPHEALYLAQATVRAVRRYFEQPGVREKYEAWLTEYWARRSAQPDTEIEKR